MIDVNWNDNAKAAVRAFADYIGQSDKCERYLEYVTTNKTVADAYEWAKGKWMEGKLAICELDGELYFSDNNLRMRNLVCTYEQFEAYAKEQEAERLIHGIELQRHCFSSTKEKLHGTA